MFPIRFLLYKYANTKKNIFGYMQNFSYINNKIKSYD